MIRSFEVPLEYYKALRAAAVPERKSKKILANRMLPILSRDKPKGTQIGLRQVHLGSLRAVIIQGTGREERRP